MDLKPIIDRSYKINHQFHEAIYEASEDGLLAEQTRGLRNRVTSCRKLFAQKVRRHIDTTDEREEVIAAIESRRRKPCRRMSICC